MSYSVAISYIPAVLIASLIIAIFASEKAHNFSITLIILIWIALTILIWLLLQLPWGYIMNSLFGR